MDESHQALWGSTGAASTFSPGFPSPPHYLLMQAAALGLDFLAIADETPTYPVLLPSEIVFISAWRWKAEKEEVIVYNDALPADRSRSSIEAYLNGLNAPWQIVGGVGNFGPAPLAASAASEPPSDMKDWFAIWRNNRAPSLPGGNSLPHSLGGSLLRPRYTGLAVHSADASGVREALLARRGWVTTSPGLWLTMQAETTNGQRIWMGNWLSAANRVTLHIAYGDRSGEVAGLALWQDGKLIHQIDRPALDGKWTLTIPAIPGSILTAVATQFDGDFAVTAPFFVEQDEMGDVLINEVLPAPRNDYNGDGVVDSNDEYIELFNPGRAPIPLEGWILTNSDDDVSVQRMKFGKGRYLGGGERLLLLRKAHRLSLRNDGGLIRLLDPQGVERDRIEWDATLRRGRSVSRIPDGGAWVWNADATPGKANANTGADDFAPWPNTPPPVQPPTPSKVRPPVNPAVEATAGQAGGPPGSIAQAKLMGLNAWVEFRAVVVAPPGLFNSTIYVADIAEDGVTAGIGINVYLRRGEYPPLEVGDLVLLRGRLSSFRGETELLLDTPDQIWRIQSGIAPKPLAVRVREIGESLEGRLVTFRGVVTRWQGDSIYLGDPEDVDAEPVRVTVRSSLGWKRPYVKLGELWEVTGLVSQFARTAPWNGGYRILVRWPSDLVKITGQR
ncbi:MAG: lamin tail domain-containing protein [Caldilinea sp.]|nr:lamin tail domain-containing protein [Caldilinea sp.]MDW8441473.1 lamin tail domain-containing protein [Caldilineaceae bacterium]